MWGEQPSRSKARVFKDIKLSQKAESSKSHVPIIVFDFPTVHRCTSFAFAAQDNLDETVIQFIDIEDRIVARDLR